MRKTIARRKRGGKPPVKPRGDRSTRSKYLTRSKNPGELSTVEAAQKMALRDDCGNMASLSMYYSGRDAKRQSRF